MTVSPSVANVARSALFASASAGVRPTVMEAESLSETGVAPKVPAAVAVFATSPASTSAWVSV